MNVPSSQPFQIIYSLYEHEYLGYLFESFVVKLDDNARLTLQHQNISSKNAKEFDKGLDRQDYELISLTDSMNHESVIQKFSKKRIKPAEYFQKVFVGPEKEQTKLLKKQIFQYLEGKRAEILALIKGKRLFEMGNDGEPTWREIEVHKTPASVLFHFRRNADNTHYFPTIKHGEDKIEFQYKGAYLVCKDPAWMVLNQKLYGFDNYVDGNKLAPFLNKRFIVIPKNLEHTYYEKFISPLIASYRVYAKGFDIKGSSYEPKPELTFAQLPGTTGQAPELFESRNHEKDISEDTETVTVDPLSEPKLIFWLRYQYGPFIVEAADNDRVPVILQKDKDLYTFHKIFRDFETEKAIDNLLEEKGATFKDGRLTLPQSTAINWIQDNKLALEERGFTITQKDRDKHRYFLGDTNLTIEVNDSIDWFDINAIAIFGEYQIPFLELRKMMLKKRREFILPNGEIAIIPESWYDRYFELFAFVDSTNEKLPRLQKHHISLLQDTQTGSATHTGILGKLQPLKDFEEINEYPLPKLFKGDLRPYQKAGYNWLNFLKSYKFGGCLADDMGLGKTIQALALLQIEKEENPASTTLIVMPTSLIYNWEREAKKFTPKLRVLNFTGSDRTRDEKVFAKYDVVLTSYGITRIDIDLFSKFYFNYVILDESQAIKNPTSNIAQAVLKLKSKNRLILTGTPLENSTMDLWSQMNFINPGLLGDQRFFVREFLKPIEKDANEIKSAKLNTLIKPFVLRRSKDQVLKELPDKVEQIYFSSMTAMQEAIYEEVKSAYRSKILDSITTSGMGKSQMMLIKGLTELRQLANHPRMTIPDYQGDSGKLQDTLEMITSGLAENHKILIFSQFVKHLTILKESLVINDVPFSYLDGSTRNRQAQVDKFMNDEAINVFLISLKAGGLGLNLTKADYVFILDPWWNPAVEAQAIDRAHRIGQNNVVFTYKFITKNTIEEKILHLQERKKKLVREFIHTETGLIKSLDRGDVEAIFE